MEQWERNLRTHIESVSTPEERDEFIAICRAMRESPSWETEVRPLFGMMITAIIDDLAEEGASRELAELLDDALREWPPDRSRIGHLRRALKRARDVGD